MEGKRDVIERAENQNDRTKYAGLGLGRVGARGGGGEVNGDEPEANGSPPKVERRNRRQSLSRLLLDRDKENKGKDTDVTLEKEKDGLEKGKGKEGSRSFTGGVRRICLISVGVEDIRSRRVVVAASLVWEVVVLLRVSLDRKSVV